MTELLVGLAPISLVDSLSLLPFAVVVLAVLLGGPAPYLASLSFLLGILASYFAAGVLIAVGFGQVIERVAAALVHWFRNPDALDYVLSIVIGIALIALGRRWATARRSRAERRARPAVMTPPRAFAVGAVATLAGLWGALPYFAAIDQILKADATAGEAIVALAFYNVVFVSLPALLVLARAAMGARAAGLFDALNRLIEVWGNRILAAAVIALGSLMLADGVGWLFGRPVLPVG